MILRSLTQSTVHLHLYDPGAIGEVVELPPLLLEDVIIDGARAVEPTGAQVHLGEMK